NSHLVWGLRCAKIRLSFGISGRGIDGNRGPPCTTSLTRAIRGSAGRFPGSSPALRFLDENLAQVERLAALDDEVATDLDALVGHVHGRLVADPVGRAWDQVGQRDAPLGVGAGEVEVAPPIDVDQVPGVGESLAPVLLPAAEVRGPGGDEDF